MLCEAVCAYSPLDEAQRQEFDRLILAASDKEGYTVKMNLLDHWVEQGRQKGREEGREEGRHEALRESTWPHLIGAEPRWWPSTPRGAERR